MLNAFGTNSYEKGNLLLSLDAQQAGIPSRFFSLVVNLVGTETCEFSRKIRSLGLDCVRVHVVIPLHKETNESLTVGTFRGTVKLVVSGAR